MQVHRLFQFLIKSEITFEHNLLASLHVTAICLVLPAIGIINIPAMSFSVVVVQSKNENILMINQIIDANSRI